MSAGLFLGLRKTSSPIQFHEKPSKPTEVFWRIIGRFFWEFFYFKLFLAIEIQKDETKSLECSAMQNKN